MLILVNTQCSDWNYVLKCFLNLFMWLFNLTQISKSFRTNIFNSFAFLNMTFKWNWYAHYTFIYIRLSPFFHENLHLFLNVYSDSKLFNYWKQIIFFYINKSHYEYYNSHLTSRSKTLSLAILQLFSTLRLTIFSLSLCLSLETI